VRWLVRHLGPWGFGLFLCLGTSCTAANTAPPPSQPQVLRVAAFGFTESEILAEIYSQALRADGFPMGPVVRAGPRELVQPALAEGLVDLVPEYAGSALSFLTLGATRGSADVEYTHESLTQAAAQSGLVALEPSPAQDSNAVVVTRATAGRFGLREISDLRGVGAQLIFGGPPECVERHLCLMGLESVYGLRFRSFVPLDTGGPLTVQALRSGSIDVALLFTTDPAIVSERFVVLNDDRELQPSEHVTPLMRRQVLITYGDGVVHTLNAVSARLTTAALRSMIDDVAEGRAVPAVAASWLRDHGLA
jgi:osmoprotectant transport system substrate-binding protein